MRALSGNISLMAISPHNIRIDVTLKRTTWQQIKEVAKERKVSAASLIAVLAEEKYGQDRAVSEKQ